MDRFACTSAFSGKKHSQTCISCHLIPEKTYKEEIMDNHMSVLRSFGISTEDEELNLPNLLDT